ncbi:hypothetical protein D5274_01610 [bacterium 1XD42-94]|jgi:hypothetical protein|nr:hypothetical protein [bacterium 1XD42-76]NBK03898.1 hypothetical protein [bacterium 1XD42-94]
MAICSYMRIAIFLHEHIAQKIEQGIGRGVRSEKDYCAILIIGSDIVKFMCSVTTNKFLFVISLLVQLCFPSIQNYWEK